MRITIEIGRSDSWKILTNIPRQNQRLNSSKCMKQVRPHNKINVFLNIYIKKKCGVSFSYKIISLLAHSCCSTTRETLLSRMWLSHLLASFFKTIRNKTWRCSFSWFPHADSVKIQHYNFLVSPNLTFFEGRNFSGFCK